MNILILMILLIINLQMAFSNTDADYYKILGVKRNAKEKDLKKTHLEHVILIYWIIKKSV